MDEKLIFEDMVKQFKNTPGDIDEKIVTTIKGLLLLVEILNKRLEILEGRNQDGTSN